MTSKITKNVLVLRTTTVKDELLFAAKVNNCMKTPEFDNIYGCRYAPPNGIMLTMDAMIEDTRALGYNYGDTSEGDIFEQRNAVARVLITRLDLAC
eukprot:12079569-Heterocapsa_arctica.AAC.1